MQHNQTLPQCIRANAEKIGAFAVSVLCGSLAGLVWLGGLFLLFSGRWG